MFDLALLKIKVAKLVQVNASYQEQQEHLLGITSEKTAALSSASPLVAAIGRAANGEIVILGYNSSIEVTQKESTKETETVEEPEEPVITEIPGDSPEPPHDPDDDIPF